MIAEFICDWLYVHKKMVCRCGNELNKCGLNKMIQLANKNAVLD